MLRRTLSHRTAATLPPQPWSSRRRRAPPTPMRSAPAETPRHGPCTRVPGCPDAGGLALIAAHRGASKYAPENTMAAFRLAESWGRTSSSWMCGRRGTAGLSRCTTRPSTGQRTARGGRGADLPRNPPSGCRRLVRPGLEGERIPSLEEVLDRFGGRMCLILELQPSAYPGIERPCAWR